MENAMSTGLSVALGLGLAAAAGFRIFVPLLVMSIAGMSGHLPLSHGMAWIASLPALIAFATATVLEVGAYYVPWLDHALDVVATPMAVVAGAVVSASVMVDLPPLVKWGVALIAGGGAAGLVQGATMLARLKSSVTTAGLANPIVATFELVSSVVTSLLSLVVPILALLAVAGFCIAVFWVSHRVMFGHGREPAER
jgi:hypothetical protein